VSAKTGVFCAYGHKDTNEKDFIKKVVKPINSDYISECQIYRPQTQEVVEMSEYSKLKEKGMGRGRPRHSEEQKAQSQLLNALRQEARRRAHLVLKSRHADEYNDIYEAELKELQSSGATRRQKRTRK
jgi:hypothetical protein